ncbi:hypothetical protein WA026_009345 [Henosepilachna vigintioctopunctata]|uniref:Uncharacterized protein n=1 Tax=Henosepilachna vigintioctopunctata TaxID=420089 RepID=A0AAW1UZ29_9CUCU
MLFFFLPVPSKSNPQGEPKQRKDYAQAVSTLIRDSPSSSTSKPRQTPRKKTNTSNKKLKQQQISNRGNKIIEEQAKLMNDIINLDDSSKNTEIKQITQYSRTSTSTNLRNKRNTKVIYGNQVEESCLQAYIPWTSIHLSKVRLQNTSEDIVNYIKSKIPNINPICEEITVKSGQYRGFKITIPANYSSNILNKRKKNKQHKMIGNRSQRQNVQYIGGENHLYKQSGLNQEYIDVAEQIRPNTDLNGEQKNTTHLYHQNIQSLQNKALELEAQILCMGQPGILCLTEHWLQQDNMKTIQLDGYELVSYFSRDQPYGGSLIYASNELEMEELSEIISMSVQHHIEMAAAYAGD